MIHCFYDKNNKEYNANCKEVSLNDLDGLIREKKHFEAQVRGPDFVANREVLSSSTVYLNDNCKNSKIWVYNLQDKETDW